MTSLAEASDCVRRQPRAVVALGGNALLPRGEPLSAANQARALAGVRSHQFVVTHGNGPQVGLLALMGDAYRDVPPYPLDVLDSETEGQIGYMLELELNNAMPALETVTVLTRVIVDAEDPAFSVPSKFVGPVYSEDQSRSLAEQHGWSVARDGDAWRRVVSSPVPRRIVQLRAIERLVDDGFLVVCAGGGGIPVIEGSDGRQSGVEAVIDKDLASALLACALGVDTLVLATDVEAVFEGYGTSAQRPIGDATPATLRAQRFAAGSMGPKVEAVCRFVERTGGRGVIGSLGEIEALLDGRAGTQVLADERQALTGEGDVGHGRAA